MQTYRRLATLAAALLTTLAPAQQSNLPKVLAQMDQASAKFQSAQAEFQNDLYERVVKETTHQYGFIYFQRKGTSTQMGAKFFNQANPTLSGQAAKVLLYQGGILDIYDPQANQIDEYGNRNNQAQYDSYLTLGFGGSGTDLLKAWTITDQGSEFLTVDGKPVTTEKLDLVSKDPNLRNNFTHITLWVDPARGISLKQVFFMPSGDTKTATYSHVRLNEKIDTTPFAIKKGVKVNKH